MKSMKQKRKWYRTRVITHRKNLTRQGHCSPQNSSLNRGSTELSVWQIQSHVDGVTHRGKKDEATSLSLPRIHWRTVKHRVCLELGDTVITPWCAFVPFVTSELLMVTLSAREVTGTYCSSALGSCGRSKTHKMVCTTSADLIARHKTLTIHSHTLCTAQTMFCNATRTKCHRN